MHGCDNAISSVILPAVLASMVQSVQQMMVELAVNSVALVVLVTIVIMKCHVKHRICNSYSFDQKTRISTKNFIEQSLLYAQ